MRKWVLLGLALIPLAGCAYYPDGYYGNRYGYYGGRYDRGYYDRYGGQRYGYRDYDRNYYRNYYRDYDRY